MADWLRRRPPQNEIGKEPEARFTYANERTFLAWSRTSLALVVTGRAARVGSSRCRSERWRAQAPGSS